MTDERVDTAPRIGLEPELTARAFAAAHPSLSDTTDLESIIAADNNSDAFSNLESALDIHCWKCPYCSATFESVDSARTHQQNECSEYKENTSDSNTDFSYIIGLTESGQVAGLKSESQSDSLPPIIPAIQLQNNEGENEIIPFIDGDELGLLTREVTVSRGWDSDTTVLEDVAFWFCPVCGFNTVHNRDLPRRGIGNVLTHSLYRGGEHDQFELYEEGYALGVSEEGEVKTLAAVEDSKTVFRAPTDVSTENITEIPAHWKLKLSHYQVSPEEVGVQYWACPYCDEIDSNPGGEFIRNHISGRSDPPHQGHSGFNPDDPIFGYREDHEPVAQITPSRADVRGDKSRVVEVKPGEGVPPTDEQKRTFNRKPTPRSKLYTAWDTAMSLEDELSYGFETYTLLGVHAIQAVTGIDDLELIEDVGKEVEAAPTELIQDIGSDDLRHRYRYELRGLVQDSPVERGLTGGSGGRMSGVRAIERVLEGVSGAGSVSNINGVPVRIIGSGEGDEESSVGGGTEIKVPESARDVVQSILRDLASNDESGLSDLEMARRDGMVEMGEHILKRLGQTGTWGEDEDAA